MVDSVQKFCASKDAGTLGQGVTHIFMVVQVEDENEGDRVMAYQEARQEVLKLTTVRICTEEEKETVVRERAPDAWQVDARTVPGRSAVSGHAAKSRWHPVIIRRSHEDSPTYK